ncbi:YggS family pyridoxal phosphate-dependent enzyme [Paenibacillus sp. GCM10023252]|uniref:YggS family pyridoxal phosphate-dependent enzyme n=1 Tax=Paenibacillus sp. GCM10023252 TaxID=3252649 RepID=UPI00361E41B1
MTLSDRIGQIEAAIQGACERSGRTREEIQIVAVTKYVSAEAAAEVIQHGFIHLGENRWQVAEEKWEAISGHSSSQPDGQADFHAQPSSNTPVWHFIGSLQTNKVKEVIGKFTYIHSLDRISLAQAIHKRAEQLNLIVPCFIQVNVSGEDSKHGLSPEELPAFLQELAPYKGVRPIGLMTMAPLDSEPEQARPVFRRLRQLRDELNERRIVEHRLTELSMGMSGDYVVAVEEGATWLRLGTALVGK